MEYKKVYVLQSPSRSPLGIKCEGHFIGEFEEKLAWFNDICNAKVFIDKDEALQAGRQLYKFDFYLVSFYIPVDQLTFECETFYVKDSASVPKVKDDDYRTGKLKKHERFHRVASSIPPAEIEISLLIKNHLSSNNKSVEMLADELQLSRNFFKSILVGERINEIGMDRLRRLAKILDVSFVSILRGVGILKTEDISEWNSHESNS